jgi:hypothetical protein
MSLLKSFNCRKRGMGYARVIHKKEKERKSIEKIDKCPRYLKQWVLRCPPKKEKER